MQNPIVLIGANADEIARADVVRIVPPYCREAAGAAFKGWVVVEAHPAMSPDVGIGVAVLSGKAVEALANDPQWIDATCSAVAPVAASVSCFDLGDAAAGGADYVGGLVPDRAFHELARRGVLRRMVGNCRVWSPANPAHPLGAPTARPNERALALALRYAAAGLRTFPCQANSSPVPGFNDWGGNASADTDTLHRWYLHAYADSAAMVGLPCGTNGLVTLDLDVPSPHKPNHKDGLGPFMALVGNIKARDGVWVLDGAPLVDTPSGGRHVIFAQPRDGTVIGNSRGNLPPGVDVKGAGGYVIAVGSVRADGAYTPVPGAPDLLDAFAAGLIPPLPGALATLIRTQKTGDGDKTEPGRVYVAPDVLTEAVACIDNPPDGWCGHDEWFPIANAFAVLSGGDRDLEAAVDEWSHNSAGDHAARSIFARARRGGIGQGAGPSAGVIGNALKQHPVAGKEARARDLALLIEGEVETCLRGSAGDDFGKIESAGRSLSGNGKTQTAKTATSGCVDLVRGDQVVKREVPWIWPGYLAEETLHILAGQAKSGKTSLALSLGAIITQGGKFPDGTRAPVGNVLMFSTEDSLEFTLAPRAEASGADMSKFYFVTGKTEKGEKRAFDPSQDIPLLGARLDAIGGAKLIIIDPVVVAVSGDINKANDVRRNLQPIVDLAAEYGAAVLALTHFSKSSEKRSPAERVLGSGAFSQLARVLLVTAVEEDAEGHPIKRTLIRDLCTMGPSGGGFEYSLDQVPVPGMATTISVAVFGKAVSGSARVILAEAEGEQGAAGRKKSALGMAQDFLRGLLATGPVAPDAVREAAAADGHSWATVRRAKDALGIRSRKLPGAADNDWVWVLPSPGDDFTEIADDDAAA